MKTITSFLLGILVFLYGAGPLLAAPACDRTSSKNACRTEQKKTSSRNHSDKTYKRSLQRQHTREAYDPQNVSEKHSANDEAPHFHKGKKMTADERNRLRQQIDEAGQSIYHQ